MIRSVCFLKFFSLSRSLYLYSSGYINSVFSRSPAYKSRGERMEEFDLDAVLHQIGGFGKYQIKRYVLFCLLLIFATFPTISYIFTTRNLNYRCVIEGCEGENSQFRQVWLRDAIPFKEDEPSKCWRYSTSSDDCTGFNKSNVVHCTDYVYENKNESTLATEFGATCDESLWTLTIVGTINNVGFIIGLPLSGYISDRFGRRTTMIASVLASTFLGIIKSFSPSYIFFIILEFLDMCLGAGAYSATYILGMELLTAEHRVVGSTIMSCAFAFGEALMGFVAWKTLTWRIFVRILYIPGLFFFTYFSTTDESVRWLMSRDKTAEAKVIMKKIAKENNKELNTSVFKQINIIKEQNPVKIESFTDVFKSSKLSLRLANCSFAWICCTFVYYGLTMHSVGISGNLYINFIAVALIEVPAYIAANFSLSRIGRRLTQSLSLLSSGIACLGFVFTPEDDKLLRLFLFLFGKFAVTISYASIYLYTTEMFPTSLRHSFMSFCSTFGRIGSMIAPQVPLLAEISKSLPLLSFAAMATSSGMLSLIFPETLNVKLPDTIEQAVHIGNCYEEEEEEKPKI